MAGDTRSRAARRLSAERQRQIFELRLRGVSLEDIARQFELTVSGVWRAYKRALGDSPESPVTLARQEQRERLGRIRARLWAKINVANDVKELVPLSREILHIEEREAKLLGLDVPAKAHLSPEVLELKRRVAEHDQQRTELRVLVEAMTPEDSELYLEIIERTRDQYKKQKAQATESAAE